MAHNEETNYDVSGHGPTMYVEEGWDVVDAAGEKIGEVAQTYDTFFVVSKGFFFPTDRYIPFSTVSRVDDECAYLDLTKDEIDSRGWDDPDTVRNLGRTDVTGYDRTRVSNMDTGFGTNQTPTAGTGYGANPALSDQEDYELNRTARDTGKTGTRDREDVELREERLRANKERAQTGSVRVGKDVETERETIEVPTTRESVDVEYHAYDKPRTASGDLTEDEIRVPVTEERVRADKETVTTGEIRVNKRRQQETKRVTGEVRKERPYVEREGDVDVDTEGVDVNKPNP